MSAAVLLAATTLRLVLERKSLTATWRTYRQYIDGIEVVGSMVIEKDGAPSSRRLAERRLASADGGRVYVLVNGEARPARRVADRTAVHYIDDTGQELRTDSIVWNAKARVFNPNPVAKLNDPSLRDQNNAAGAVPDAAYTVVDLPDLPPSGMLVGPNVAIVDTDQPFTAHADASQPLLFDRSQPQFEEVNAYFHIDRTQRYIQSLGYTGDRRIVGYAIPVDPHAANGADNSFYVGGNANGMGQLFFGDGGTDDAEDSDIMLHEFGHAIQDWIAPGVFGGPPQQQSRALGEGFGDYWSFSQNYVGTLPSGRDPFCIADWDARCFGDDASQNCSYPAGADCLRRVDSTKTMADYVVSTIPGTEYRNGEIWSSALREIFVALVQQNGVEPGRRISDTIVLEGTFGVPPDPTFNVMARKLLDADRSLYGGAHAATICGAMTKRGIITTADCGVLPRGELTIVQSSDHGLPIASAGTTSTLLVTDARLVDRLLVRVDIEHPTRGDLRIVLIAPDGTTRTLFAPSLDRLPDIHATFGSDIEPIEPLTIFNGKSIAGVWKLVVTDTHGNNVGRLLSWSLVVKFAGDEPLAQRPAATQHIVAVAHADGADGTKWRSDLFLFNKAASATTATIIYTPSGADGTTNFGAVNVSVAPGEVAVFRDVVMQLFNTDGLGTLAIGGSVQAWSRAVDTARGLAEVIEAVPAADAVGVNDAGQFTTTLAAYIPATANLGAIETAGQPG
ncbi:MAG TPA: proprotein convertase P-domain-containing protein, partial [Thermoanaerobaculia bacterium]|nr:proprotein convertase P-domain-containing protein [Thermoanaerobaculia bacterium]